LQPCTQADFPPAVGRISGGGSIKHCVVVMPVEKGNFRLGKHKF
jgi:hypothetical protein